MQALLISWCLRYPFLFTQSKWSCLRTQLRSSQISLFQNAENLVDSYNVTQSSYFHKLVSLGNKDGTLSVPVEILDSLLSRSIDCKDVVQQLKEKLNLDQAALQDPDPNKMKSIRYLARKANIAGRYDVIKELRSLVPAGTTGRFAFKTFPTVQELKVTKRSILCNRNIALRKRNIYPCRVRYKLIPRWSGVILCDISEYFKSYWLCFLTKWFSCTLRIRPSVRFSKSYSIKFSRHSDFQTYDTTR